MVYSQSQIAPDFAAPATRVRQMPVSWRADRDDLRKLAPFEMEIGLEKARLPSLAMFPTGSQKPIAFWTGSLRLPSWPPENARKDQRKGPGQVRRPRARSFDRADYFVGSSFRFEEVEVLGFRIDLDRQGIETVEDSLESPDHRRTERIDDLIEEMIEPLNFHHGPRHVSHFRYRPATRTVSLELLRYGRMRLKKEWQDLTVDDVQSQHELLIRVLVGRVDDDTGQAHDPATYVPTLFVDNPWSKALGREVQGFDKRLADFCIEEKDQLIVLRPDGRRQDRPEAKPVPLTRIDGSPHDPEHRNEPERPENPRARLPVRQRRPTTTSTRSTWIWPSAPPPSPPPAGGRATSATWSSGGRSHVRPFRRRSAGSAPCRSRPSANRGC